MALPNVYNFRDLGGLPAGTGTVRFGRLYRSDSLHRMTPADTERLLALGVRTVVDLRRPREVERDGRLRHELLRYHHLYPRHPEWDPHQPAERGAAHFLAERYLEMAIDGITAMGAALRVIADPRAAPVVVHCFAGKDRTGVLTALTLALVGVPDRDIATDYARSAASRDRLTMLLREQFGPELIAPEHFVACPPEAILLFLAELRGRCGGLGGYARAAGLTAAHRDALRTHLVEPHGPGLPAPATTQPTEYPL